MSDQPTQPKPGKAKLGKANVKEAGKATRFKKGHPRPANSSVGPVHPELNKSRKLTAIELTKIVNYILYYTPAELEDMASRKDASALSQMVCALVLKVIKEGDTKAWEALMSRLVGKVKDQVEVSGTVTSNNVHVYLPHNEREALSSVSPVKNTESLLLDSDTSPDLLPSSSREAPGANVENKPTVADIVAQLALLGIEEDK